MKYRDTSTYNCIVLIIFFTLLDQTIKIIIEKNFEIGNSFKPIISNYIYFFPTINKKLTYINVLLNKEPNIISIVTINSVLIILGIYMYKYLKYLKFFCKKHRIYMYSITMSGIVCSLIDKVFWGGSLDYIGFGKLFIFDLKDIYITSTSIFWIYLLSKNNESDFVVIKGFIVFCLNSFKKQ